MQILEELYLGSVRPSERSGKRNAQYRKALDNAINADDAFRPTLTEDVNVNGKVNHMTMNF